MKVNISQKLNDIYKKQHKNFDYAVTAILDNFDPESYVTCFNSVKKFELDGERCEIIIGDKLTKRIVDDLEIDKLDDKTAELLLWLGVIFPEV